MIGVKGISLDKRIFWYIYCQVVLRLRIGSLGWNSYVGPILFLKGGRKINIGNNVRIFPGARIECHGDNALLIIEDNVSIGHGVFITVMDKLVIKSGTVLSGSVFINNLDVDWRTSMPFSEKEHIYRETEIGENCFIGYNSSVQAGTILGNHCVVGSNTSVHGNWPPGSVISGVPGKLIRVNPLN